MTDQTPTNEELRALLDEATEGPWVVPDQTWRRSLTVEIDCGEGDRLIKCPGSGGAMSYTDTICTLAWSNTAEWEANGRLIALAPTLARQRLAAEKLREALDAIRDIEPDPDNMSRFHQIAEEALAAYEKGEG